MKGLAVTAFIEEGQKEWVGEGKVIAGLTSQELRGQLNAVVDEVMAHFIKNGGWNMQDVGLYIEVFDVAPVLQAMYEFHAVAKRAAGSKSFALTWNEIKSRKGEASNGRG